MMVLQLLRHQREAGGTPRSGGEEGRVNFISSQFTCEYLLYGKFYSSLQNHKYRDLGNNKY